MNNAQIVKFIRKQYGLNQRAFAQLLNVSLSAVKAWEQGQREPSGSAVRLLQLLLQEKGTLNQLMNMQEDKLMFDLDVDEKQLTIMGVQFKDANEFYAAEFSIANNMYEGYVPTVADVTRLASDAPALTPAAALAQVRDENEAADRA